ncbi:MAG: glycosyltransferase family 4 protein [Candidatus Levybacteria bacterium]|nr:glycosyltransferase family 4 protein [Candidatus Levybacteria bacterium]
MHKRDNDNTILQNKSVIIATHYSSTAFIQHLEEFLRIIKIKKLLYIGHPLHPERENELSFYRFSKKGKAVEMKKFSFLKNKGLLTYLKDGILNIVFVLSKRKRWDLYIGADNLNTISGVILKKLGFVDKVIFYTVDFVPQRFENKLLNNFYHWVEKLAVIFSDEVWILSPRVIEGRRNLLELNNKYDKKQKLVPEGVWIDRIKRLPFFNVNKHSAIFVGHIVKRMGVQIVIRAMPIILERIPDFILIIIGKGDYKNSLEKLAKNLGVSDNVKFMGYVEDHKEVENIIASCGVGIATYTNEDESGLTFYADPAKTKLYLGAGIPVVMTDTFYNAYDIQDAGGGIVIKESSKEAASAIISIIGNDKRLKEYRRSSLRYAKQFDYPSLLAKHLKRVFV